MVDVVLFDFDATLKTQVIRGVQIKESDMNVFIATGRAISVAFGWRQPEDWEGMQFINDVQSKALCRHITIHSWLTDDVIYVPVPGLQLTHETYEIVDEAVLRNRHSKASEFNILQAGLESSHLELPPHIYTDAKYCLISLQDYEPLIYFNESHYCGYFGKPRDTWSFYNIPQLPNDEVLAQLEGIVITGAKYAAYDLEVPWMGNFLKLLEKVVHNFPRIKVLGICLGCQASAVALGGAVIKDPNISFIHKLESITTTDAARAELPNLPQELWQAEVHQDFVKELPPGGTLYASSESCGVEMWGIPGRLVASQFHPEFSNYFINNLMSPRLELSKTITAEYAATARETFTRPSTSPVVIKAMSDWLHSKAT